MILTYILQIFLNVVEWFLNTLPNASTLPWGVDAVLSDAVGYLRFMIVYFPPLGTLVDAFLIYLGFILVLKIVQMIPIIRNILY